MSVRDIRIDNMRGRRDDWTDEQRDVVAHQNLQTACANAIKYAENYGLDCAVFKGSAPGSVFMQRDARFCYDPEGTMVIYFVAKAEWNNKRARKLKEKKQDTGVNSITGKTREPKPKVNKKLEALKRKAERQARRKRHKP